MSHGDYAVCLQFCCTPVMDPLLNKGFEGLDKASQISVMRAVHTVAAHGVASGAVDGVSAAVFSGDTIHNRIGSLLGATTALSSSILVLNDASIGVSKGPHAGDAAREEGAVDMLYESLCAIYYMIKVRVGALCFTIRFAQSTT